jgi:Hint domain/Right handed beta helix region
MATITVNPGGDIQAAINTANPGDTIDVTAGSYNDQFLTIEKSLTLQAVGGEVVMTEDQSPPDGKAMITEGQPGLNVAINGFDISGVSVPDSNGAAIRYEGGNLTLAQDYFHNNQEGLLGAADPNGSISIDDSEFASNGDGSGSTHNIYVGAINSFSITNSYIHDAVVGHEIKSRAANNTITGNRIFDNNGSASYSIDLPNGGNATIQNNVIEQGAHTQNPFIIAYGEEGVPPDYGTTVAITANTIVNDDPSGSGILDSAGATLGFTNNSVFGLTEAKLSTGPLDESGTTFLTTRPTLDTSPIDTACYARGTMIRTDRGEVSIEELSIGDRVVTHSGKHKPIKWIGRGQALSTGGRQHAATPVIVRKAAIADNVPVRDLRITKGHALFIDGVLIPVEELINHRSIFWDDRAQEVQIYHIELETHDVLIANGAPAESYRDDGNRWLFRNANSGWHLPPQEPCAPLLTSGPVVDAIWRRLLDRAGPRPGVPLTDDPDLHLLVDGQRVDGKARSGGVYAFRLPRRPSSVHIISRAGSPDELGIARDPRLLGVALRQAVVWRGPQMRLMEASDPALAHGFHQFEETNGLRWTDGDALLSATLFDGIDGACDVELHVGCTTWYPLFAEERSIAVSAAA